jgi:acetyl-CoA carboxylase carboxyltransferase component
LTKESRNATSQVFVRAWPSANFSSLPSAGSAAVARRSELEGSADPEAKRKELMARLEEKEGPYRAEGIPPVRFFG